MSEDTIFQRDVGTTLVLDLGEDVSMATTREIIALLPDGTRKVFQAEAEGLNSIKYTTTVTGVAPDEVFDISQPGKWKLQARVVLPSWQGRGAWAELLVKE